MNKIDKSMVTITVMLLIIYGICITTTGAGIPCIIKEITNLYCPGCGITRLCLSLLRLDFYQAFRYNPLVFIYIFGGLLYGIIYFLVFKLKKQRIIISNSVYILLIVITIVYGIMRNIPYFSYLAPTIVK